MVLLGVLGLGACHRVFGVDPLDAESSVTWKSDEDGDGYNAEYTGTQLPDDLVVAARDGDCHDDNAMAFPGSTALEVPRDGIDTDCDGNDFCTDLNCDGLPDVAIPAHFDGDYVASQPARLLSGDGGWRLETASVTSPGATSQLVRDLDGDGYQDIVHANINNGTSFVTESYIYWGKDEHAQASRTALPTNGAIWVCAADLDRNGWTDLVFANHRNDAGYATESYVYWNRSGAFAPTDRVVLPTTGTTSCEIADLDGDGELDLVFAGYVSAANTYAATSLIYWGSPAHDYPAAARTMLPTVGTYTGSIADLDADGRPELVFWSHYDGADYESNNNIIYWNRGDRFATIETTALDGMGGMRGSIADLNADGHLDIIVAGYNTGLLWTTPPTTYIYWGNPAHTYGPASRTPLSAWGAREAVVDDINGDGHADIYVPSYWDGDSRTRLSIFWGSAGGTYSDDARLALPSDSSLLGGAVADFDHDGFKDVFVPGYHNNMTGADPTPWANQAFSRIYWGSAQGLSPTIFSQWPTRGAWRPLVVGR